MSVAILNFFSARGFISLPYGCQFYSKSDDSGSDSKIIFNTAKTFADRRLDVQNTKEAGKTPLSKWFPLAWDPLWVGGNFRGGGWMGGWMDVSMYVIHVRKQEPA